MPRRAWLLMISLLPCGSLLGQGNDRLLPAQTEVSV